MQDSFLDVLTDEMKNTLTSLKGEVRQMFKGTKPFRGVKIDDAEKIQTYLNIKPQQHEQYRAQFGDEYMKYVSSMEQKIQEYGGK
jgi:hypothetical protein